MKAARYIDLEDRLGAHIYHPLDVVIERGEGVWVWDVDGNKYLDCLAAYSAVNQGHCHPRIMAALKDQIAKLTLTSRAFRNDQLGVFYQHLTELTGFDKALPMNTGAEAVETTIKIARKWGYTVKGIPEGEAEILVMSDNFHGRTTTIVGFSSEDQYRAGFGPFAPGFRILPYGDIDAAREAMHDRVAAILVEPIQGEAGIIIPPEGYLSQLRSLTTERNVLLAFDEIQSGLGRTGKLFAYQHEDARPDLLILGKALSGGAYPVSAVLGDDEVMDVMRPGDHGSTYGGNPVAAAVAIAALETLVDEGLVDNSAELGEVAMSRLEGMHSEHVKEIRGRGLWLGIELHPAAGGARRFCEALEERGILCKETHEHVIRVAPPLVITREELDWALDQIEEVLATQPIAAAVAG